MHKVERFWLGLGLYSKHGLDSGTSVLDWTRFHSGVTLRGFGIFVVSQMDTCTFRFSPVDKRVVSLHNQVEELVLTVICAPNNSEAAVR